MAHSMTQPDEYHYHTICTPELVEIQLPLAGVARRSMAMLVDQVLLVLVIIAIWSAIIFLMALFGHLYPHITHHQGLSVSILIIGLGFTLIGPLLYFWAMHTFNNGQTLGKLWLQIQVVTDRGGKPNGLTHFIRALFTMFEMLFLCGSASMLMILFNAQEKHLADYAAGTVVILKTNR